MAWIVSESALLDGPFFHHWSILFFVLVSALSPACHSCAFFVFCSLWVLRKDRMSAAWLAFAMTPSFDPYINSTGSSIIHAWTSLVLVVFLSCPAKKQSRPPETLTTQELWFCPQLSQLTLFFAFISLSKTQQTSKMQTQQISTHPGKFRFWGPGGLLGHFLF